MYHMKFQKAPLGLTALAMILLSPWSMAQTPPLVLKQAYPAAGCKATPAELAANKKVAIEFFRVRGMDRVALADPSYKQHNPVFKKRGEAAHETDYEEFKNFFANPPPPPAMTGPTPPMGNPLEIVTAECDMVTIVHMNYRQDPQEAPGVFYQAYTFDTFRVNKGKLTEHWDAAMIMPTPPPAPAAAPPAARP